MDERIVSSQIHSSGSSFASNPVQIIYSEKPSGHMPSIIHIFHHAKALRTLTPVQGETLDNLEVGPQMPQPRSHSPPAAYPAAAHPNQQQAACDAIIVSRLGPSGAQESSDKVPNTGGGICNVDGRPLRFVPTPFCAPLILQGRACKCRWPLMPTECHTSSFVLQPPSPQTKPKNDQSHIAERNHITQP